METDCLAHRLTSDERAFFETNGYLIVENAIPSSLLNLLISVVDRVDARERTAAMAGKLLSVSNVVQEDDAMVDLLDLPTTFPKVWGILGWIIYLYHSHLDVTPRENATAQNWSVAWHQDSMRVNDELESNLRPRLPLKVGYYLSAVREPGRGNTLLVPGTQLWNEIEVPQDGASRPDGCISLCVPPGSALLLDRRTWHSRSANASDLTRKVIWYGYSYCWLRPKDEMTVAHLLSLVDPVRRQILGGAFHHLLGERVNFISDRHFKNIFDT